MTPLQAFFDWQIHRVRLQLASGAPLIQRPAAPRVPPSRRYVTAQRGPYLKRSRAKHGTLNRYVHGKCRCAACRRVHAAYQHAYHMGQQQQRIQQQGGAA